MRCRRPLGNNRSIESSAVAPAFLFLFSNYDGANCDGPCCSSRLLNAAAEKKFSSNKQREFKTCVRSSLNKALLIPTAIAPRDFHFVTSAAQCGRPANNFKKKVGGPTIELGNNCHAIPYAAHQSIKMASRVSPLSTCRTETI